MMDKKLTNSFKPDLIWTEMEANEQVGFDAFYDELSKWAVD